MYKTSATNDERNMILEKLRRGATATSIAFEIGITLAKVCEIRNAALRTGELKINKEEDEDEKSVP